MPHMQPDTRKTSCDLLCLNFFLENISQLHRDRRLRKACHSSTQKTWHSGMMLVTHVLLACGCIRQARCDPGAFVFRLLPFVQSPLPPLIIPLVCPRPPSLFKPGLPGLLTSFWGARRAPRSLLLLLLHFVPFFFLHIHTHPQLSTNYDRPPSHTHRPVRCRSNRQQRNSSRTNGAGTNLRAWKPW